MVVLDAIPTECADCLIPGTGVIIQFWFLAGVNESQFMFMTAPQMMPLSGATATNGAAAASGLHDDASLSFVPATALAQGVSAIP